MTGKEKRRVIKHLLHQMSHGHHGDCVGADYEFHNVAEYGFGMGASAAPTSIVIHPPINEQFRAFCIGTDRREAKPYLNRNRDIVDECDVLIAAPKQTVKPASLRGQGTWLTVEYAHKQGKPVYIVFPDGSVKRPEAAVGELKSEQG